MEANRHDSIALFGKAAMIKGRNHLEASMIKILRSLSQALLNRQIQDPSDPDFGAIRCHHCDCLHTRAGEAVFPLAVCYKIDGQSIFLKSAIDVGNWLVSVQKKEGIWEETPIKWYGTTVFQLMSLAASYPILRHSLSEQQKSTWLQSIERAAFWICNNMSERLTNINYCASSGAALALAYGVTHRREFQQKAGEFAELILKRINKEGFICGEGKRFPFVPFVGRKGVDLGYNMDMSLGALALYSVLRKDPTVMSGTIRSIRTHLDFMYPDGSIDGSWGSRSYKWTTYGSKTAHGCQMVLGILRNVHSDFREALGLSLEYLSGMMRDGLLGYGPHSWWDMSFDPCIYPTFTRANAIAFGFCYPSATKAESRCADNSKTTQSSRIKFYRSVNVCLVETDNLKATVSGYRPVYIRYGSILRALRSFRRYLLKRHWEAAQCWDRLRTNVFGPTGGSLSLLWAKRIGIVQASSQTNYLPIEPMHMPQIDAIETLTPHIRLLVGKTLFSNLYDIKVRIRTRYINAMPTVICRGKLKSINCEDSGVRFQYEYEFASKSVTKTVRLWSKEKTAKIEIIEPIVKTRNMQVEQLDDKLILRSEEHECTFSVLTTNAALVHGQHIEKYWSPFPYLYAYPVKLMVNDIKNYPIVIKYNIAVE